MPCTIPINSSPDPPGLGHRLAAGAHCVSPAWQSNKSTLYYFTPNHASEIRPGTGAQRPSSQPQTDSPDLHLQKQLRHLEKGARPLRGRGARSAAESQVGPSNRRRRGQAGSRGLLSAPANGQGGWWRPRQGPHFHQWHAPPSPLPPQGQQQAHGLQVDRKLPHVCKLKHTVLPTSQVKEAMTREIRKHSEPKDDESTLRWQGSTQPAAETGQREAPGHPRPTPLQRGGIKRPGERMPGVG